MNIRHACKVLEWSFGQGELAIELFEKSHVKFGEFQLKNSLLSPSLIYFDLRTPKHPQKPGTLAPETVGKIGRTLFDACFARHIEYDIVVGIPYAGDPFAPVFQSYMRDAYIYDAVLLKEGEGARRKIAELQVRMPSDKQEYGKRVLLLDDVISGADSKFEAIRAVEKAGFTVSGIAVLIDREQGGTEKLKRQGYQVISVYEVSHLLAFYVLAGKIFPFTFEEIMEYIERVRIISTSS